MVLTGFKQTRHVALIRLQDHGNFRVNRVSGSTTVTELAACPLMADQLELRT